MRISKFITDKDKPKLIMRTFIESQFNFCPLVWMCHSRQLNHKINHLHERALRVVYKNNSLTFKQLLEINKSFTIHERNLQKLPTEMYKVKHNLCPKPFQEIFTPAVRGRNDWIIPSAKTVNMDLDTEVQKLGKQFQKRLRSHYHYLHSNPRLNTGSLLDVLAV